MFAPGCLYHDPMVYSIVRHSVIYFTEAAAVCIYVHMHTFIHEIGIRRYQDNGHLVMLGNSSNAKVRIFWAPLALAHAESWGNASLECHRYKFNV